MPQSIDNTGFLICERATKRCISVGKNDQKYGIYPFDKLELVDYSGVPTSIKLPSKS